MKRFDPIKYTLKELPPFVYVGDLFFSLSIFKNGSSEMRLAYTLDEGANEDGAWNNPYIAPGEDYHCGFLILYEGIECLDDLRRAVMECKDFLTIHGLLPVE